MSLHPAKLCPSLYLEIFLNLQPITECQPAEQSCSINSAQHMFTVAKLAIVGKEALFGMIEMFNQTKELCFSDVVDFKFKHSSLKWLLNVNNLPLVREAGSVYSFLQWILNVGDRVPFEETVGELLPVVVSKVPKLTFRTGSGKWQDVIFQILFHSSNQKALTIENLQTIDFYEELALERMAERGVVLRLKYLKHALVRHLPSLHYDLLSICPHALVSFVLGS